jgi:hypothetical protein
MELGGKGSFQAAKLQRSARTTVCSHSTRDMAAMRSIDHSVTVAIPRTSFCPVVDMCEVGAKTTRRR